MKADLPLKIVVPSSLDERGLLLSMSHRVNGRVPCLTYFNAKRNIAIWRSSQPNIDLQNPKRNKFDEAFIGHLRDRVGPRQIKKLYIFNHTTAKITEEQGLLFENAKYYQGCKLVFYDIPDHTKIARGYQKLFAYCNKVHRKPQVQQKFMTKLAKSGWLDMVDNIISAGFMI